MELTLCCEETLALLQLSFRYPNNVQITSPFTGVIILEGRRLGVKGSKRRPWLSGTHHFGPRGSVAVDLASRTFVLT